MILRAEIAADSIHRLKRHRLLLGLVEVRMCVGRVVCVSEGGIVGLLLFERGLRLLRLVNDRCIKLLLADFAILSYALSRISKIEVIFLRLGNINVLVLKILAARLSIFCKPWLLFDSRLIWRKLRVG